MGAVAGPQGRSNGDFAIGDLVQNAFADPGCGERRMPNPAFAGSTAWSESLVTANREAETGLPAPARPNW